MKNKMIIVSLLGLIGLSIYLLLARGCKGEYLRIHAVLRPAPKGAPTQRGVTPMYDVAFSFNQRYPLTSLKVVAAADAATNKHPVALWHVIADERKMPVKSVTYGKIPPGMKPAVAGLEPESLQPNTEYLVLVEAAGMKAQTNFIARERLLR
jgi:hypothetical protein